eukprot:CAMPEP_0196228768 /NCGR_PEP_ID=MMETSP0913-20130531/599_1 /TAXON_ID=49265 /ORGANISM="Thalassiosira rotula, Strain GSO102" /LENGTH=53 /DNA_ID=CAMNT_0041508491 /DNA_START=84 /DNA_END=242 /DNA_ORIENTATION=-
MADDLCDSNGAWMEAEVVVGPSSAATVAAVVPLLVVFHRMPTLHDAGDDDALL